MTSLKHSRPVADKQAAAYMNSNPLAHWDDANILLGLSESKKDLMAAAVEQPNSEWHECCFAAAVMFAVESNRRGIRKEVASAA